MHTFQLVYSEAYLFTVQTAWQERVERNISSIGKVYSIFFALSGRFYCKFTG